jgi:hypothetical protein
MISCLPNDTKQVNYFAIEFPRRKQRGIFDSEQNDTSFALIPLQAMRNARAGIQ